MTNIQRHHELLIANRFRVNDLPKNLVGSGGMGDVYRGIDTHTNETVAIKVLHPKLVKENKSIVARFIREGEALKELNHPNIVKMLFAIEDECKHYLVMEFVFGGSLQQLLDSTNHLPINQIVEIALDLADALTRAHRLNIIHRDLKPANILLADDGTPRLTDFGIAWREDNLVETQTDMIIGTPPYLSPETIKGNKLDSRTDIWAFGVLIYEMIANQKPFIGSNIAELMMAICNQPIPELRQFRDDIPEALEDLIYRMLEKNVDLRIPSMRLIGVALESILGEFSSNSPSLQKSYLKKERFRTVIPSTQNNLKNNLPVQLTPIVDRVTEREELNKLLALSTVRLITIYGAGGMGKTRLSLAIASKQFTKFPDGVYWVSLAPINTPKSIVPTIAEAIRLSFYEGAKPERQLLDYLRQKKLLLILDNFEHLLDGSEIITEILQLSHQVKVIITSREPLNLQNEYLYQLSGIDYSQQNNNKHNDFSNAIELFVQRANTVRAECDFSLEDMQAITQICHLVQGMPLGILLAASWVSLLNPVEILNELEQSFDFLETNLRDIPERHRSIKAVFNYSWNLLTEQEQNIFQHLSVFRGGFSRQTAQKITDTSLITLRSLVNKSLLYRESSGRYEIHELLRQYAEVELKRKADDFNKINGFHCKYFLNFLSQQEPNLKSSHQISALESIQTEIKNIQIAWKWAVKHKTSEVSVKSIDAIGYFYKWEGRYQEGEIAFRVAVENLDSNNSENYFVREVLLKTWYAFFLRELGKNKVAEEILTKILDKIKNHDAENEQIVKVKAFIYTQLGYQMRAVNREESKRLHKLSKDLYQELNDQWEEANALADLSWVSWSLSDYKSAKTLSENSLVIRRTVGDKRGISQSLSTLGFMAIEIGKLQEGESLIQESVTIRQEIGDKFNIARGLQNLGVSILFNGEYTKGLSILEESVMIYLDLGIQKGFIFSNTWSGIANALLGKHEIALNQCKLAMESAMDINHKAGVAHARSGLGLIALFKKNYSEACNLFKKNAEFYKNLNHKFEYALSLSVLSIAYHHMEESELANLALQTSLEIIIKIQTLIPLLYALAGGCLYLKTMGEELRAKDTYKSIRQHPHIKNSSWFELVVGEYIDINLNTSKKENFTSIKENHLWEIANELLVTINTNQIV